MATPRMADAFTFTLSMVVGLAPALFLLWFSLRRFDYPRAERTLFDDRRVFLALAVGLGWGAVASTLALFVADMGLAGGLVSVYVLVFALVLLEESFKMAYLGRRGYRMRFDTTFTGVALGVGSAATLVAASGILNPAGASVTVFVVFSITMSLMHAVSGALIGFGAAKGTMGRHYLRAVLARGVNMLLLVPFFVPAAYGGDPAVAYVSLGAGLAEGLLLYRYVYAEVLPETLPKEIRRELRRWRARSAQGAGRTAR